jgi:hypothetical protein
MVKFVPNLGSILWELKTITTFDNVKDLTKYVAEQATNCKRFIGDVEKKYHPHDVGLIIARRYDRITGMKNCFHVILDGKIVGYCGE